MSIAITLSRAAKKCGQSRQFRQQRPMIPRTRRERIDLERQRDGQGPILNSELRESMSCKQTEAALVELL
jgi:hypothetical protein